MKSAILKNLSDSITSKFKSSLKKSKLTADKRQRDFLLNIDPKDLCLEFKTLFPEAYFLLVEVILGTDNETVFNNKFLMRNVCLMYSMIARLKNRKATAYALFLGMVARDGGLSHESLKMFSEFCHPGTLQKYDYKLAAHSDAPLNEKLEEERQFIDEVSNTLKDIENLQLNGGSESEIQTLYEKVDQLNQNVPAMLTTAWDNLNLSGERRHERITDKESLKMCFY